MNMGEVRGGMLLPEGGTGKDNLVIQRERSDRRILGWFRRDNDNVLPCPCVVAKYAQLRFRLAAKASPAPLLLLFGRDLLRWVRVRGEG